MALDEPTPNDETFNEDGYTFIMEKSLASQASYVKLDMSYMGFSVTSDLPITEGGSCSTNCGAGGCGH